MRLSGRSVVVGIVGVVVLAFAGHGLLYVAVQLEAPVLYVRGDSGFWLLGSVGRLALYWGVGILQVLLWRRLTKRQIGVIGSSLTLAALAWFYWFAIQPNALLTLVDPDVSLKWMNLVRPVPVLGEVYSGWGFGRYHLVLIAAQGTLSGLVLLAATALRRHGAHDDLGAESVA